MATKAKEQARKEGKHGKAAARAELPKFDPNDVVIIGHDTKDGPEHYLCDVASNAEPLSEATVRFTMTHGVVMPVSGERDGDRLLIVAGRGRTRHLREANKRLIAEGKDPWLLPVVIKKGDEGTMYEIRIGENSHRRKISPMVRAREAQTLLDKGRSPQQVADTIGVTPHQLKTQIIPLLSLATPAVVALESGKLSQTAAAEVAKLPKNEQPQKVAELTADGAKPTVRETKNKIREASGQEPIETPKGKLTRVSNAMVKLAAREERGDRGRAILSQMLKDKDKDDLIETLLMIDEIVHGRPEAA